MAELKTKLNDASVVKFLSSVEHEQKRKDSFEILNLMKEVSGEEPSMWGDSIIGFGTYHYKYASGREGDWMRIGFSPRKQNISLYLMCEVGKNKALLEKVGKHKTGKGCFYINKLADVNKDVLKQLIRVSLDQMNKQYPPEKV